MLLRGPVHTFRMLTADPVYERRLRIQTARIENLDAYTLAGKESDSNHHYQGASYPLLYRVFQWLPAQLHSKPLIDYGCGKGRALFVAEQCGFTSLIGVDIASELLDEARINRDTYQRRNPGSHFEFVFSDATNYAIPADAAVFYFFNPFDDSILERVADLIRESHGQRPRELYVVYVNPKYKEVFQKQGFTQAHVLKSFLYTEAIVYTLH